MHLMNDAFRPFVLRRLILGLGLALAAAACSSGGGAGWTYAPLGPTPAATGSGEPSPSGGPSASPGLVLQVETTGANPLAFVPNVLEAPAATVVQVDYMNNSSLPHNINFFDGPDNTAPSLGLTEVATGPNALESVTITTPEAAGDYYFWCDVHFQSMAGTLRVTP